MVFYRAKEGIPSRKLPTPGKTQFEQQHSKTSLEHAKQNPKPAKNRAGNGIRFESSPLQKYEGKAQFYGVKTEHHSAFGFGWDCDKP